MGRPTPGVNFLFVIFEYVESKLGLSHKPSAEAKRRFWAEVTANFVHGQETKRFMMPCQKELYLDS